jgi:hypothetical protein
MLLCCTAATLAMQSGSGLSQPSSRATAQFLGPRMQHTMVAGARGTGFLPVFLLPNYTARMAGFAAHDYSFQ